jgi:hypothetical protein
LRSFPAEAGGCRGGAMLGGLNEAVAAAMRRFVARSLAPR